MSNPFDQLPAAGRFREIVPADVLAHRNTVKVVDVREPHEFNGELGHIEGAVLVPLATVIDTSADWDKGAELVMVCRSGGRSGRAADALAKAGFSRVSNMLGGMLRWNEEQHPTEK